MLMFLLGTIMGLGLALITIEYTTKYIFERTQWEFQTIEEVDDEDKD